MALRSLSGTAAAMPPDLARRGVATAAELQAAGVGPDLIQTQLHELYWRRIGKAIVLHYGPLTREQTLRIALFAHGPSAVLASFTALTECGLEGWSRPELHLLVPPGITAYHHPELPPVVLHYRDRPGHHRFRGLRSVARKRLEPPAGATIRAGASCLSARVACGVLAAVVHQGAVRPGALIGELQRGSVRHQEAMLAAAVDMRQHDDALADLDLAALCSTRHLPVPVIQRPRELAGRRRYLEAAWQLPDGRALVVEVDGALHLAARRWWEAQLRPSDLTVTAAGVLRIPSAVLRHEPDILLNVLRRSLTNHRAAG